MNAYLADRIARDHADALMAQGAAARRVRRARQARRAAASHAATTEDTGGRHAGTGHLVARPFAALHTWLSAGML